jgi:pimeloyl-ACP methyl ester carboxylesterase
MAEPTPVHVETGGGTGPRLLLLHGSGASGAAWTPVIERLADTALAPSWLVVDLPGHGRSGRLPAYGHEAYAAAIAQAISEVEGVPRVDLVVGHSLGGLIALTLADQSYPLTVGGVLAMAVKVRWTAAELARRAAAASRLAADPAITAAPPAGEDELATVMSRVRVPTQLVCGDRDRGIDPSDISQVLGRPVHVVTDAGHNLHTEQPATIAQLIEAALRRPDEHSETSCA